MRRGILAFLCGLLALVLVGCTIQVSAPSDQGLRVEEETSTPNELLGGRSQQSIGDYRSEIAALQPIEESILARYSSVTGENYTDDLTTYNELVALVPDVRAFLEKIEAIMPSDPEIAKIHELYVEGWNAQSAGMLLSIDALAKQDFGILSEANQLVSEGRFLLRQYSLEMDSLGN